MHNYKQPNCLPEKMKLKQKNKRTLTGSITPTDSVVRVEHFLDSDHVALQRLDLAQTLE